LVAFGLESMPFTGTSYASLNLYQWIIESLPLSLRSDSKICGQIIPLRQSFSHWHISFTS